LFIYMKLIEIIVPLYNEQENIVPLYTEIAKTIATIPSYQFQIFFIDDGSKDQSFVRITGIGAQDPRVKGLSFSRNFGKEMAITAGIRNSKADAIIIMDADLQHPPSVIPELIKNWENGSDLVVAMRKYATPPPIWKQFGSYVFNKIFGMIAETPSISGSTDFRLLDKKVVNAVKRFTERNRMVRGLIDWLGFKRTTVDFISPPRFSGEASYSPIKLARLAVNSFTSFSLLPLKITGYLGIMFFVVFGCLGLYMAIDRLTVNNHGFTNLSFVVVLNSFSMGIVMIGLGLIALYVGHIYTESVNRPLYVVDKVINFNDPDENA
jgi:polyisoprenyl-phosphate glycosyltransferase